MKSVWRPIGCARESVDKQFTSAPKNTNYIKLRIEESIKKGMYAWLIRHLPHDIIDIAHQYWSPTKTINEHNSKLFSIFLMFYQSDLSDMCVKCYLPDVHAQMHRVALLARVRGQILERSCLHVRKCKISCTVFSREMGII